MIRNLFGFAIFAVIAIFLLKVFFGLFGLILGLLSTVVFFACIGFFFYLILKVIAPETAARVKETIAGRAA
jgi:O-antigen/teichoic acid export membrane protein